MRLLLILSLWNAFVFLLYAADKGRAVSKSRRIQEKTLLLTAFFLGGVGALLASLLLRHKTRKMPFPVLLPLFCLITLAASFFLSQWKPLLQFLNSS